MSMSSEIDHSTLRWVKKELDETLREAAAALERFSEDPADATQAQFCIAQLHQVRGILQMLELHGAAMLTEEMEQLGAALLEGDAARGESGAEVLMGAILRLRDYLERLEGGQQDAALLILPLVNELRAARGEAIIAESALFSPDLGRAPEMPRHDRDGADHLPEVAGAARTLFQRGLLGFLRGQGVRQGLERMREAADQLDAAAPDDRTGAVWWVVGTVAEALAAGALNADAAVRNLIGQVDRQIKAVARHGAEAERPEALMRGLLYYLAGAAPATPRIEAVQTHYDLPALIADQQRLEQAREGLFGPGVDAFRSVAEAIREDLAGVKDTLDLYVRGSAREPERLGAAADAMRRIADTLGVLGLAAPRRVVLEQAELVRGLEGSDDDALTVMKAAESLLYVESALQGLGGRAREGADGGPAAAPETPEAALFRSEYREVVALTLDEAITEVGRVKEAIVRFLESHDGVQLEGLDERFASIRGALGIMELPRAAALVGAAAHYVTERLASDETPPPAEALDDLADAVTSIEYYLEALRDGRSGAAQVLDVAENGLRRLGEALPAAAVSAGATAEPAPTAAESAADDAAVAESEASAGPAETVTDEAAPPAPDRPATQPDAAIDFSRKRGRVDLDVPVRADELDAEIVEIFVEEAGEVLETLAESFPRWRANPDDEPALLTTRRMFHTLKGSGRLAGALLLGELAWAVENLLNRILDRSREADESVFDVVKRSIDAVPGLLQEFQGGAAPATDVRGLMREAARLADPASAVEAEGGDEEADTAAAAAAADEPDADTSAGDEGPASEAMEPGSDAAGAADADATETGSEDAASEAAGFDAGEGTAAPATADAGEDEVGAPVPGADEPLPAGDPAGHGEATEQTAAPERADAADAESAAGADGPTVVDEDTGDDAAGHETADHVEAAGEHETADGAEAVAEPEGNREPEAAGDAESETAALPAMDPILYDIFSKEAEDHLAAVDAFLARAAAGDSLRVSHDVIRSLHTLTGSARMADVEPIARLGRRLEDLARIRFADRRPLSGDELEVIERSVARVREIVAALGRAGFPVPDVDGLVAEVDALKGGAPVPSLEAVTDDTEVPPDAGEPAFEAEGPEERADGAASADEGRETDAEFSRDDSSEYRAELDAPGADSAHADGDEAAETLGFEAPPAEDPADDAAGMALAAAEDDAELRAIFLEEAEELRGHIESLLADWEAGDGGDAPAESLQRALHTLKGGARLAEQAGIARLCHAMETLAAAVAEEGLAADGTFFRLGQRATDHLGDLLRQAADDVVPEADEALVAALEDAADAPADTGDTGEALAASDTEPESASPVTGTTDAEAEPPPDEELVEVFLEEAGEILAALEAHLNEWREGADEESTLVALQRALHTLKGGARMAGFQPVANLAHALETLLREVQEGGVAADPALFELLEAANDALVAQREAAEAGRPVAAESALVARIEAMTAGAAPAAGPAPAPDPEAPEADTAGQAEVAAAPAAEPPAADESQRRQGDVVRVRSELLDDLVNFAGEVSIYRARLEQQAGAIGFNLGELGQTVRRLRDQLRTLEIETEAQILHRAEREYELQDRYGEDFDPLEMDRFSQIQELSRALSESVNDLSSIEGTLDNLNRESETLLLQQSRVNAELQDGLMRTRMVPFANLAPRLRRIVRQASQELGREARLRVLGAEGEMDRTVLERIVPPLEHMLRNAVAHGIEAPEVRRAAGKPEGGTISVSLAREGADVVIRVADDGGGMDLAAIRRKAVRQGLMNEDSTLTDREVMQFVLESGFSTAEEVTQIAGRGVGMDVVNAEIKQLGGNLEIDSTPGEGTRFTVRLPFTLALNQALLCEAGDEVYAVPLSSVEGVVRMTGDEVNRRLDDPDGGRYEYAGTSYALRSLSGVLGAEEAPRPAPGSRVPLLLVQAGESRMALQVDGLLGSRDIVVKSPGPQIASVPGVLGATILADGRVVLILDVSALVRFGMLGDAPARPRIPAARAGGRGDRRSLVMVVDDSITMRKVASRLLERNDIDVITAKDGVDAVAALQDRVPDAMLLDIEMPRMDGYEVAVHMRNDPRLRDVPIVMITSRTGEKHRQRALDIGVDRYIGKPYQEGDLLATVRELLEHGRASA
ncbi:Hpt domain-containing protein [Spiribacter halobius]|uniref:Chemotaxis protein CheA n=1 Tax=Sediminicurvatus halobius TaxID=2182432 RepID=A0A2U2MYW3_9GAMM|nr:Hpt domain-containing protein [Spiribacter halobius]PWG61992.1 hypothetical protein DEM34_14120 [Spiribacter halobius]UEX78399.1 Hpt domain-containing protein [Spiribacter halobius]